LVAAIEPDAFRIVALEGVMPTTRGSAVRVDDGPNWSQFAFFPKSFSELDGTMSITASFWKSGYGQGGEGVHCRRQMARRISDFYCMPLV